MADKYVIQRRTASGLETVAELPALESGKIDLSWLPVVGESGAAIIARGSNANGEWVRWEDGTQVCYGTISPIIPAGSTIVSSDNAGTYPAAFISVPSVVLSGKRSEINLLTNRFVSATMLAVCVGISSAQSDDFSANCCYIAIGRWK